MNSSPRLLGLNDVREISIYLLGYLNRDNSHFVNNSVVRAVYAGMSHKTQTQTISQWYTNHGHLIHIATSFLKWKVREMWLIKCCLHSKVKHFWKKRVKFLAWLSDGKVSWGRFGNLDSHCPQYWLVTSLRSRPFSLPVPRGVYRYNSKECFWKWTK